MIQWPIHINTHAHTHRTLNILQTLVLPSLVELLSLRIPWLPKRDIAVDYGKEGQVSSKMVTSLYIIHDSITIYYYNKEEIKVFP
jgi:glucose-6-phosphate-specific signal transduction histidine kinase